MALDAFSPSAPPAIPPDVGPYSVTATGSTVARTLADWAADDVNARDDTTFALAIARANSTGGTLIIRDPVTISTALGTVSAPVRFEGAAKLILAAGGSITLAKAVTFVRAYSESIDTSGGGAITFSGGSPAGITAATDTNSTQLATTAFVIGQAAGSTSPMDGSAAVGTSTRYARQDHVHPIDTSRAPVASPTFTGTVTAPKLVTSAASGSDAIEIVQGSILSLDGASATQALRFNDGTAASIPGAQAWQAPTLLNSWANFGAPGANAGYYRDAAGVVRVQGLIKSGTAGTTAFTLPAGYRPLSQKQFLTFGSGGIANVLVDSSGNVQPSNLSGSNVTTYVYLEGISFRAEQ